MGKVIYKKGALKFIQKHPKEGRVFIKAFNQLKEDWEYHTLLNIKRMEGMSPTYKDYKVLRLRVGKYRAIFERSPLTGEIIIFVLEIGSRGDIYK